jgi:hypothetical protein
MFRRANIMHDYYHLRKLSNDRELAVRKWRNYQFAQEALQDKNAQPKGLRILFPRWLEQLAALRFRPLQPPRSDTPVSAR